MNHTANAADAKRSPTLNNLSPREQSKHKRQQNPSSPLHLPSLPPTSKSSPAAVGGGCPYLGNGAVGPNDDKKDYSDCYYHQYLQLDKILNANEPRSAEFLPSASHDEHLFITIHQAYELWFKQILFEMRSCIALLGLDVLDDREMLKIVSRLQRINSILKLLVEQFSILDSMTPMSFLDFRKFLKPASGFQSVQFRVLENKLGLRASQRMRYNKQPYTAVLSEAHAQRVSDAAENEQTLFGALEKWLQRFPYLASHDWSFWRHYKAAVREYLADEQRLYGGDYDAHSYAANIATFNGIFDEAKYEELRGEGKVRLRYEAMQAALMIMLYREEPVLQMPFRVLELAMEVDSNMTQWRSAHAQMVHRMLGSKMGTGGSSGFHYLRTAAVHHKVFADFFNLSTYMIPRSNLPPLPQSLKFFMSFPSTPRKQSKSKVTMKATQKEFDAKMKSFTLQMEEEMK